MNFNFFKKLVGVQLPSYLVARKFCGSLVLRIGDFFVCVLRELIFAIRTGFLAKN